jgi:RHS repeat-associated protein
VYKRDHDNRVIQRTVTSGGTTTNYYYGATGGSNYTFMWTNNTTKQVVEKYLSLPGGVSVTLRPLEATTAAKTKASLRNLHGDTMATLNGDGVNETGVLLYEPFGTQITPTAAFAAANPGITFASATPPSNMQGDQSAAWAGAHRRSGEVLFAAAPMQMGERIYIPGLGRFLTVDSVEGGTQNNYVYVNDPINNSDYSGQFAIALGGLFAWAGAAAAAVTAAPAVIVASVAIVVVVVAAVAINNIMSRSATSSSASTGGGGGSGGGSGAPSPSSSGRGGSSSPRGGGSRPPSKIPSNISKAAPYILVGYRATDNNFTRETIKLYAQKFGSKLEGAVRIMEKVKMGDPKYQEPWQKYQYSQKIFDGSKATVHWFEHPLTGEITQVKFK